MGAYLAATWGCSHIEGIASEASRASCLQRDDNTNTQVHTWTRVSLFTLFYLTTLTHSYAHLHLTRVCAGHGVKDVACVLKELLRHVPICVLELRLHTVVSRTEKDKSNMSVRSH